MVTDQHPLLHRGWALKLMRHFIQSHLHRLPGLQCTLCEVHTHTGLDGHLMILNARAMIIRLLIHHR